MTELTDIQRQQLVRFSERMTTLASGDQRWRLTSELQRAGMVRLEWTPLKAARIVLTEAGRAALPGRRP